MSLQTTLIIQAILVVFLSGILFAFSDFILKAFNKLPPKHAVAAMQHINVTVYQSVFMAIFVLLVPISIASCAWSVITLGLASSVFAIVGSLFYIVGVCFVTGAGNVPLNESLKKIDANQQDTNTAWRAYYKKWTRLNTLRSIFGILAGASWLLASYANL